VLTVVLDWVDTDPTEGCNLRGSAATEPAAAGASCQLLFSAITPCPEKRRKKGSASTTASAKRCLGTVEQLGGISKIGSIGEFS